MRNVIRLSTGLIVAFGFWHVAQGQEVQVSRTNRTISVVVTESVRVDPEIARISVGYHNFARTKQIAYEENVRLANKIAKALLDAGVPKNLIETETFSVGRAQRYDMPEAGSKELEYAAEQIFSVRVPVAQAQAIVDRAVGAGANKVEEVEWAVTDPMSLEAKANSAALAKALTSAERMAKELRVQPNGS